MIRVFLKGELSRLAYTSLLEFVAAYSSEFYLVKPSIHLPEYHVAFFGRARPFLLKRTRVSAWPGTTRMGAPSADLFRYRLTAESLALLQQAAASLYDWLYDYTSESDVPLPEDLGFLRPDGRPILVSVTHERDAYLYLDPAEFTLFEAMARQVGIEYSIKSVESIDSIDSVEKGASAQFSDEADGNDDTQDNDPKQLIGQPMPLSDMTDLNGNTISPDRLRGKPLLIDFFATWCGPCRMTAPVLQRLHETYEPHGLVVIGASASEGDAGAHSPQVRDTVANYVEAHKLTYLVTYSNDAWSKACGVEGYPTFFFVKQDGTVREVVIGYGETLEAYFDQVVQSLLV